MSAKSLGLSAEVEFYTIYYSIGAHNDRPPVRIEKKNPFTFSHIYTPEAPHMD